MNNEIAVVVIPMEDLRKDVIEYGLHCLNCSKKNGHFCNGTPRDCENAILIYLRDYVEWMQPKKKEECVNNDDDIVHVKGFTGGDNEN